MLQQFIDAFDGVIYVVDANGRILAVGRSRPPLEVFDPKGLPDAPERQVDNPVVSVCGFCQRLRRPGSSEAEAWISADDYYRPGGTSHVRVSQALCADCEAARFPESGSTIE